MASQQVVFVHHNGHSRICDNESFILLHVSMVFYIRKFCVLCANSLQLCPTLCDPMDCNLLGSSVHGILQARILGWVVISFFRGFSQPRDQTFVSYASCIGRQVPYH